MIIAKGLPTTPTLAQLAKDVDGDGKVDIAIQATMSDVAMAVQFELEISEATSSGGTFVVIDNRISAALKQAFKAKTTRWYKVRYRPIYADGTIGTWSALSAELNPAAKSAAVTAPTSLIGSARPKSNLLVWSASTEKDYSHSILYRHTSDAIGSATEVAKIKGTKYPDQDALTANSTYYYWVAHVDTSGNVSAKYPTVNGVSVTHAAVAAGDTDATVLAAPAGTPSLTQRNQDVDADGTVDIALQVTWAAVTGAVRYEVEVSTSTTTNGVYTVIDNHMTSGLIKAFAASTLYFYRVRVRAFSFNGTAGAWSAVAPSATTGVQPAPKTGAPTAIAGLASSSIFKSAFLSWTPCPDDDYAFTRIYRQDTPGGAVNLLAEVKSSGYVDSNLTLDNAYNYWFGHVNTSGICTLATEPPTSGTHQASVTPGRIGSGQIENAAIRTVDLNTSIVTDKAIATTAGTIGTSTTATNIQEVTSNHGTDFENILVIGQFLNVTAGTLTIDIRVGTTNVYTVAGIAAGAAELIVFARTFNTSIVSGSSSTFRLRVTRTSGSGNVSDRHLSVITFKR